MKPPSHAPGEGRPSSPQALKLITELTPNGYVKRTPSGRLAEKIERKPDGEHHQYLNPAGKVEREVVQKTDGSQRTVLYGLSGKAVREEVAHPDGTRAITTQEFGRDGYPRVRQTVNFDSRGREISKTVTVNSKNAAVMKNTTVVNNAMERQYVRGRYGFVYQPVYAASAPALASWYDPYWYSPAGVSIVHPFRYKWGWEAYPWYINYHGLYWTGFDVYPAPSYWVTDWLIAGYLADHYAASVSVAQAREEARLAREEAAKAREAAEAAEKARDEAEIREARAAQAQAELRVKHAEERAARAERQQASAGKPNPNATPIDQATKEALKNQVEATVAEKKQLAEQSEKAGHPVLPDLSQTLADPNHIYLVSKTVSVISAKDQSLAGTITEGDLLKLEPGQAEELKGATENTLVTMRVMTCKGEEGEVAVGTLISVPLKEVQEFENEFRAKLDLALAEADTNKDIFKRAGP